MHFMAEAKWCEVVGILGKAKYYFFSLLLEGSIDKGKYDNELV